MIDSKKYINALVKNLFSLKPDENKNILTLLRTMPDVESYRIFLEEYLCFKFAMAEHVLMTTDFLKYNDAIHTGQELIRSLLYEADAVINTAVMRIPNFFSGSDIQERFYDRLSLYPSGKELCFHTLFKSKLPASIADKIDNNELCTFIYGAYHLVEDEIGRMAKYGTAKKEMTIIREVFPNIGKSLEFIIAVIIYFIIPILVVKWFNASKPVSLREMYGIICSVCSSVYLLHYSERMSGNQESTESNLQWLKECMLIGFLVLIGILIVK